MVELLLVMCMFGRLSRLCGIVFISVSRVSVVSIVSVICSRLNVMLLFVCMLWVCSFSVIS